MGKPGFSVGSSFGTILGFFIKFLMPGIKDVILPATQGIQTDIKIQMVSIIIILFCAAIFGIVGGILEEVMCSTTF